MRRDVSISNETVKGCAEMKLCTGCGHEKSLDQFYRTSPKRGSRPTAKCKDCVRASSKQYHAANRDAAISKMRERYRANKDDYSAQMADWRAKNAESLKESKRQYAKKNKKHISEYLKEWRASNKHVRGALNSQRRAYKKKAIVTWANRLAIKDAFSRCQQLSEETGVAHNVDHVVPLLSPRFQSLNGNAVQKSRFVGPLLPVVQGLHTEQNLQVITQAENIAKKNVFWPDMPNYQQQ